MSQHPKTARSDHDILDVIRDRWSPRAFDASRPVSRADLLRLFEAARWAPSSGNEQPWRFVVTERAESPAAFEALSKSLTGRNPHWAQAAPVLVLVAVHTTRERGAESNEHAWYDTGQAVGFLALQATAMGLGVRQMEGFDHAIARDACAVPPLFEPAVVMAIGAPGDPESLTYEKHRESERAPRTRKAMEEFVYWARWRAGA